MERFALFALLAVAVAACSPSGAPDVAVAEKAVAAGTQAEASCKVSPPGERIICTMEWRPVCGCDGVTYSNACSAKAAGVKEFTDGECDAKRPD